jgi:hypothetical protein
MEKTPIKVREVDWDVKDDPVPRGIYPRDPRFHVVFGRFVKSMEKPIYRAMSECLKHRVVAKGLNNVARARVLRAHWDYFNSPVALKVDAHRFEAHIGRVALGWTHGLYRAMCSNERSVMEFCLRNQLEFPVVGNFGDGTVRFKMRCRSSGDFDTGLGNTIVSVALWASYSKERGVKTRLIFDGDDGVIFLERNDLDRFLQDLPEWFQNMGFVMTVGEPVDVFEKVLFCACQPVFDGKIWVMVRSPKCGFLKDLHSCTDISEIPMRQKWLSAVGQGGIALAGDIPLYCSLYSSMLAASANARPLNHVTLESGLLIASRMMGKDSRASGEPSMESRVSFWKAFGIQPYDQVLIENSLSKTDWLASLSSDKADVGLTCRERIDQSVRGCVDYPGLG